MEFSLKLIKRKICICGCGGFVTKSSHKFIHGHNSRIAMKNNPEMYKKLREGVMKKYGVDNVQKLPEIKRKSVKTRKNRYSHWMGDLSEEQIKELKSNCSLAGKIGGKINADRWKENPEEFNEFLRKGHEAQKVPGGHYEKNKGINNPMSRPDVKQKHLEAVIAFSNDLKVKEKRANTINNLYGDERPYLPRLENHYRWKGGISFNRGLDWKNVRLFILVRDDFACIICKSKNRVHVHHIIPVSTGIDIDKLNDPFNLVSLCINCHMKHEPTNCFEKEIIKYLNNWGEFLMRGFYQEWEEEIEEEEERWWDYE